MPGMPYMLEKGELFAVVEDYIADISRRLTLLQNLKDRSVPVWDTGVLWPAAMQHVRVDWLGNPAFDPATKQFRQPPVADPSQAGPTGFWKQWHGPAEAILRETLQRSIEVSLGVEHVASSTAENAQSAPATQFDPAEAPAGPYSRWWPVEMLWVCGAPNFQGWITWRKHGLGPTEGQVTVVFTTPAPVTPYPMYDSVYVGASAPPASRGANYKDANVGEGVDALTDLNAPRGVWVVGSKKTLTVRTSTTESVELDDAVIRFFGNGFDLSVPAEAIVHAAMSAGVNVQLRLPSTLHYDVDSYDEVAVVRPSMFDGGMALIPPTFPHP